jgi:hypothetical protein
MHIYVDKRMDGFTLKKGGDSYDFFEHSAAPERI